MAKKEKDKVHKVFLAPQEVPTDSTDIEKTISIGGYTKFSGESSAYGDGEEFLLGNQKIASMRIMTGTSKSLYGVLKSALKQVEGGFMLDSRDGGVKIHNHNFGQSTKLTYTYAGGNGELLKASFKTQKKAKPLELSSSSKIDPETKTVDTTVKQNIYQFPIDRKYQAMSHEDIYSRHLNTYWRPDVSHDYGKNWTIEEVQKTIKNSKSSSKILSEEEEDRLMESKYKFTKEAKDEYAKNYQITKEDRDAFFKQVAKSFDDGFNNARKTGNLEPLLKSNAIGNLKIKKTIRVKEWFYPEDYAKKWLVSQGLNPDLSVNNPREYGMYQIKHENPTIRVLNTKSKKPTARKWTVDEYGKRHYFDYHEPILALVDRDVEFEIEGTRVFASATPQEFADVFAENELSDASLHQVIGTLITVGRPEAMTSMAIHLNNVSQKYGGRWYTKKVKHSGNSSGGYTCEMMVIRCGGGLAVSSIKSKVHTPSLYNEINKIAKERVAKGNTAGKIRSRVVEELKELYKDKKLEENTEIGVIVDDNNNKLRFFPAKEKTVNLRTAREEEKKKQSKK